MASSGNHHLEVEVKSDADKFWECIKKGSTVFPKALPDSVKSVQVLQGDGTSAGSVCLITYPDGSDISNSIERIDFVEEENRTFGYSVTDGDVLKFFKSFRVKIVVKPREEGTGSSVSWSCEYERGNEPADPNHMDVFVTKNMQDLDAYVLKD